MSTKEKKKTEKRTFEKQEESWKLNEELEVVLQFFQRPVRTNTPARDIETNHTLNNEKIPFINQIPIFFYQKIQLEVAYKMTKPDLYIYIYGFDDNKSVGELGGCTSLHAPVTVFLLWHKVGF